MENKPQVWPQECGLTPRCPQPGRFAMTPRQRSLVRQQVKKGRKVYL